MDALAPSAHSAPWLGDASAGSPRACARVVSLCWAAESETPALDAAGAGMPGPGVELLDVGLDMRSCRLRMALDVSDLLRSTRRLQLAP